MLFVVATACVGYSAGKSVADADKSHFRHAMLDLSPRRWWGANARKAGFEGKRSWLAGGSKAV
jgi:hypothetical protein